MVVLSSRANFTMFVGILLQLATLALGAVDINRQPLAYASKPAGTYELAANGTETLLDWISAQNELSTLRAYINQSAGFFEAFNTPSQWSYTFFAPSNTAFEHKGEYFNTFYNTAKGKYWFGNILTHHYIPNSALALSAFNSTRLRLQTGSYLYVSTQVGSDGNLKLNDVATVTNGNNKVEGGRGIVHIVDRILDPSYMIYESDIQKVPQAFIAGSCSNTALPYC